MNYLELNTMLGHYGDVGEAINRFFVSTLLESIVIFLFAFSFKYRVELSRPLTIARASAVASLVMSYDLFILKPLLAAFRINLTAVFSIAVVIISYLFVLIATGRYLLKLSIRDTLLWAILGSLFCFIFDILLSRRWIFKLEGVIVIASIGIILAILTILGRKEALRQKYRPGIRCSKCGYDLRGNVSRICPECGTENMQVFAYPNADSASIDSNQVK